MKIVITQKDIDYFKTPEADYQSNLNCPLAKVMKKVLGYQVNIGTWTIGDCGRISPRFGKADYNSLRDGEIEEFVTEYTPITN